MDQLASEQTLKKTIEALEKNGIKSIVVNSGSEAKKAVLDLIPKGSEVMTMTSVTLETLGLEEALNSSEYKSVKNQLGLMKRETQGLEMQKLGAGAEYSVGSVHAITEDGHVFIASNTGSQLSGYVYGSPHVIWIVGTQKIVKDFDSAMKRVYDYVLPLESERAQKAYGSAGSNVSKLLIVNKEVKPDRITIVFVKEKLGF